MMKSLFRPFPVPLSNRQLFYILVIQGLGAGLIDGGANFAIAYAMYHGQSDVRMWVFSKNTIAGDLGVTPIVQCLASMLITSTLVHTDLHHHAIAPLPFVYPHVEHLPDPRRLFRKKSTFISTEKPSSSSPPLSPSPSPTLVETGTQSNSFTQYVKMLVRFIFEGTEKNMMLSRLPPSRWFGHFLWTAAQGAAIGIVFGFPIWCLAIVILGPIYGTGNMGNKWAPQVIKCIYGAIVGWVTNPVIAILALGSQADHHLVIVEHDEEGNMGLEGIAEEGQRGEGIGGTRGVSTTIPEDEELTSPRLQTDMPLTPGSTRTRQLSVPLPPTTPTLSISSRQRAGSNASRISSRPPLTQDVSTLSPLPTHSALPLPPSPSPGITTGRARGYSYTIPQRPRGATVSSYSSNRSYSYALGGTGGRAQRPRAQSRASAMSGTGLPALVLPPSESRDAGPATNLTVPGRSQRDERTPAWDVFGRNEAAPGLAPPVGARQRAQSAAATINRGPSDAP